MPRWDGRQPVIGEINALKRQSQPETAQKILESVSSYVQPIMRRHNYRVHKVMEFLPKSRDLLGLNVGHGLKICLRLRFHHDPTSFLPFNEVLGTMLHELCHNTHGPHNSAFHKLLDELNTELEDMMARGFRGEGFIGQGYRLGARPKGALPKSNGDLIVNGGYRLGPGSRPSSLQGLRKRRVEALMRRSQADKVCASSQAIENINIEDLGVEEISLDEFLENVKQKSHHNSNVPIDIIDLT